MCSDRPQRPKRTTIPREIYVAETSKKANNNTTTKRVDGKGKSTFPTKLPSGLKADPDEETLGVGVGGVKYGRGVYLTIWKWSKN